MTKVTIPQRRGLAIAVMALLAALVLAGCMSDGQAAAHRELNADRGAHGLRSLPTNSTLNAKAQRWAEKMARDGRLSHSTLTSGAPSCWRSLGENVGYGSSAAAVQDGFMRSSGHRANVLSTRWTDVGVGYARNGSRVYVAQVFMTRC